VSITDLLRLPADLVLTPVEELPADVRERFTYDQGDYAVTRPRARAPTRIVDAAAVELLREFTHPSTVASAVIRYARARGASPETTLEEAYPLLARLFASGLLVSENEGAGAVRGDPMRGELVGGWELIEPIQLLDDSEVCQVRKGAQIAILKIERPDFPRSHSGGTTLAHEAGVLRALDGAVAPRLIETGEDDGRAYLAIEWCPGIDAEAYARELRHDNDRDGIVALCREIVAAYATLHARGFVHGDVHPRNVLVGRAGEVRLIDFGAAAPFVLRPFDKLRAGLAEDDKAGRERAGVGFFYEPEFAAAMAQHRGLPPPSSVGEQYAVAALLYLLASGGHYLDFSLDKETLYRQIVSAPPRRFAAQGKAPWPELEAVLERALSKSPEERYPTMDAMAAALAQVKVTSEAPTQSPSVSPARALLDSVSAEIAIDGALAPKDIAAPTASVFSGAAGIACALYRLALLRDDAAQLAAADMWLTIAESSADSSDAFLDPANNVTAEIVGTISPFHTAGGLAAMRTLISNAQGDVTAAREAAARFTRLSLTDGRTENRDITLGRSSVLLAAALLGDVLPDEAPERAEIARFGGEMLDALWSELDVSPALALKSPNLGMAHGWSGYAYAALRFCRTFEHPLPRGVYERVGELCDLAEPWGRGVRWPWNDLGVSVGTMPGWCNGSAGFVQLFSLAHLEFNERRFLDRAIGAAWNAWEGGVANGSLCCGEAGRAYALIALARALGNDATWLARADKLADRAALAIAKESEKPHSLFKGRIGVALLAADLEQPDAAAFPFFEDEGWR
jgi:serine/threonine-protein kinase